MKIILFSLLLLLCIFSSLGNTVEPPETPENFRQWIATMKEAPRGPFKRIRWYCNDGLVLPPEEYACVEHGGGIQHGEWNDRIVMLRSQGFLIGNVLAEIRAEDYLTRKESLKELKQLLLERFLIASDDGWIFRRARYYRGALQAENETASGQALLQAMTELPLWRKDRFLLLREAARLLPHRHQEASITEMRQHSRSIAEKDTAFEKLRIKIHVQPDPGDAALVRLYAKETGRPELSEEYLRLAETIEAVYIPRKIASELESLSKRIGIAPLTGEFRKGAALLTEENPPEVRLQAASYLLALIRDHLGEVRGPERRVDLLDLSLDLEGEIFRSGNDTLKKLPLASRRERLAWVKRSADALYGIGLLTHRQWQSLQESCTALTRSSPSLKTYKAELDYLSRVPGWTDRQMQFLFAEEVEHLSIIEPLTRDFIHDRLRGSPLLFCASILDSLIIDANRLLGVQHRFFGATVAGGLRALNPGLGRGRLYFSDAKEPGPLDPQGIYVLPATTADLTPVAGIITAREGNALSHVQLLARNLGIPNVVIDKRLLNSLKEKAGGTVVLAVSARGVVRLEENNTSWNAVFRQEEERGKTLIREDPKKLDLDNREILPLTSLHASDAGRIAGPKAANLGELKNRFPEYVPEGLVLPFGLFRSLLERPMTPGEERIIDWMRSRYAALAILTGKERDRAATYFLKRLQTRIRAADFDAALQKKLRRAMERTFGPDGTYGVFVRSDTNLEDLPGFTGAGLNLTVPHVVGFENILTALRRVWTSPFTERSYAWRQAYMEDPEHVYVSVLLLKSVPAEKSGVMVTRDLESGSPDWLSVAVNEGVGGAVSGQGAEELRIEKKGKKVRLLAQATEPRMGILLPEGGIKRIPASGRDALLSLEEIVQLRRLALDLPKRFPSLLNAGGEETPADIEFGFLRGKLILFQIRPFLDSARAQQNRFLNQLDEGIHPDGIEKSVELDEVPPGGSS